MIRLIIFAPMAIAFGILAQAASADSVPPYRALVNVGDYDAVVAMATPKAEAGDAESQGEVTDCESNPCTKKRIKF